MATIRALNEQGQALVTKQKAIYDDGRPWTTAKKAEFDKVDGDIKAVFAQRNALVAVESGGSGGWDQLADLQSYTLTGSSAARGQQLAGKTLVRPPRLELTGDQIGALADAGLSRKSLRVEVDSKTTTDSTTAPMAGIPSYRMPPVTFAREPQRVADLLPGVGTDRPVEVYYRTTGTAAAAAVAEGATKPTSTLSYTAVTATMTKIAHLVSVTDEALKDIPTLVSIVQQDMTAGLIDAENAEILSASGTAPHNFTGLLNTTGALTRVKATETYDLDVIEEAIDDLRTGASYTEPTAIVLHPTTWGILRRTKDTQGRYLVNPDPTAAVALSLFGFPVTLTTKIPTGTALLGDFQGASFLFVRDGITVEMTNTSGTDFEDNTTTMRCEERISLAVTRPASLIVVTGLT